MRILSGIQPSGTIHIGNYFGMIKKMIDLQDNGDLFAFIASYHALTSVKDKDVLKKNTFEAAINFLALGMDPEKSTFFVQHHVKEVLELYMILSNHTSMGLLERSHAFKEKTSKGLQSNHGLFSYPILMAADILLYDAEIVPVGKDQIQHIEMTRDIATSFNNHYKKEILILPKESIDENVAIVPGIDGNKMSKSYGNTIDMFCDEATLKKQVSKIITNSTNINEPKEYNNCNIYKLCKLFMDDDELEFLQKRYLTQGQGYGHFKQTLVSKIQEYFEPYNDRRNYYLNNLNEVEDILEFGSSKARKVAQIKMEEIREIVGLI